jgi:hypothetical protein
MTDAQIEQCKGYNIEFLRSIQTKRILLNDAFSKEDIRHREEIAELNKGVELIQNQCPHPEVFCEYVPDPWHSYEECTLCGKQGV